jgi:hypothetical protein
MCSTMEDVSSKSSGTSSTFTSQKFLALDDMEFDYHPIDASFFDIHTVSHVFHASTDFFPDDIEHFDDLHVYPREFPFCGDHVVDVRLMDSIAFKSSSGEEWEV